MATILIGIIIGVGIRLSGNNLTEVVRLDPELFFIFLLPGIIFDAGYNLEKVPTGLRRPVFSRCLGTVQTLSSPFVHNVISVCVRVCAV
mgnify:CR=1 FL=1